MYQQYLKIIIFILLEELYRKYFSSNTKVPYTYN